MRRLIMALLLAMGLGAGVGSRALAEDAPAASVDALAQMELTDTLINQYLEAQPDVGAAIDQAGETQSDNPDPKLTAKLEQIAKKHNFANFGQFDAVAGNIALVLEGVDPTTKKYIGPEAAIKKQIAELRADPKISAEDKKGEIAELEDELKSVPPVKFKGNIDVVLKYYDKLAGQDEPPKN